MILYDLLLHRQLADGEHLDRLGQHLAAALAEQQEDKVRAALTEVELGLLVHGRALSEL